MMSWAAIPRRLQSVPFWASGALLGLLVGGVVFPRVAASRAGAQPIAFNHAKHVSSGIDCADCHTGAQSSAHATLPDLETCMTCHAEALGNSPEEAKLRRVAAEGGSLHWSQLLRLPPDIYFSHRRHVQIARLECATCHGRMAEATSPPTRPFWAARMQQCLDCHRRSEAGTGCNDCHR